MRNLELRAEDVIIALQDGLLFPVECDQGVTGMVLVGRGELRFSPASATERGQLRIFSGADSLNTAFETAYIRFNPGEYAEQIATATLTDAMADAGSVRAQEVFKRESPRSFGVDVSDMTRDTWHLLRSGDDFLAEVDTRRFDTLTYLRSSQQAEDVSLFRRSDRKTITLYPSVAKLAARGRFYSDDTSREYDVLDYAVTAAIDPQRQFIRGRARLSIRVRSTALPTLHAAARGLTHRVVGVQRRIRPPALSAARRTEHDRRQHAAHAVSGFGPDADRRVRRTPGVRRISTSIPCGQTRRRNRS